MKLVHEYGSNSWGNTGHRILYYAAETDPPTVGEWALYDHPAFLECNGKICIALSDYYEGSFNVPGEPDSSISEIILESNVLPCSVADTTIEEQLESIVDEPEESE